MASRFNIRPADEFQLTQEWLHLASQHQFELQVCIAASNRRGIVSTEESSQSGLSGDTLEPGFCVTGLGQLAAALAKTSKKDLNFNLEAPQSTPQLATNFQFIQFK